MNSGLIARILAGGMALSILGVSLRYGSQYDSIQEGIEALKDKGESFYNQYILSEEAKNKLQNEFDTLEAQYLNVLGKLGLDKNATLEDVQSKLEELTQGGANEAITDIAELLGIENAENATIATITQAIADLEAAVTQLEANISRLRTELENANLDLAQANEEEKNTVEALDNALAYLEALEGGGAPGAGGETGDDEKTESELLMTEYNTLIADITTFCDNNSISASYLFNNDSYLCLAPNGNLFESATSSKTVATNATAEERTNFYNKVTRYRELKGQLKELGLI